MKGLSSVGYPSSFDITSRINLQALLSDPGKARGCCRNTIFLYSLSDGFSKHSCQPKKVRAKIKLLSKTKQLCCYIKWLVGYGWILLVVEWPRKTGMTLIKAKTKLSLQSCKPLYLNKTWLIEEVEGKKHIK